MSKIALFCASACASPAPASQTPSATVAGQAAVAIALVCAACRRPTSGSGQAYSRGGKRQAEASDGGAAEFGILMQAHRDHANPPWCAACSAKRSARNRVAVVAVDGDAPAGLRIAVDGGHRRILGAMALELGGRQHEGQLRDRPVSASTSVSTKRSAPRARRRPGRLSSCTTSMPSAVQAPAPGLNVDGVGLVVRDSDRWRSPGRRRACARQPARRRQ